jgi:hypothetical protein
MPSFVELALSFGPPICRQTCAETLPTYQYWALRLPVNARCLSASIPIFLICKRFRQFQLSVRANTGGALPRSIELPVTTRFCRWRATAIGYSTINLIRPNARRRSQPQPRETQHPKIANRTGVATIEAFPRGEKGAFPSSTPETAHLLHRYLPSRDIGYRAGGGGTILWPPSVDLHPGSSSFPRRVELFSPPRVLNRLHGAPRS